MATKVERTVSARAVREANNRIIGSATRKEVVSGRFVDVVTAQPGYTIVTVRKSKSGETFISSDKVKLAGERAMSKHTKK